MSLREAVPFFFESASQQALKGDGKHAKILVEVEKHPHESDFNINQTCHCCSNQSVFAVLSGGRKIAVGVKVK
jgi:hypothetical protein